MAGHESFYLDDIVDNVPRARILGRVSLHSELELIGSDGGTSWPLGPDGGEFAELTPRGNPPDSGNVALREPIIM